MLDTDQTHTEVTGRIDLHDETVEVLPTPHPKSGASFFCIRRSVYRGRSGSQSTHSSAIQEKKARGGTVFMIIQAASSSRYRRGSPRGLDPYPTAGNVDRMGAHRLVRGGVPANVLMSMHPELYP